MESMASEKNPLKSAIFGKHSNAYAYIPKNMFQGFQLEILRLVESRSLAHKIIIPLTRLLQLHGFEVLSTATRASLSLCIVQR